MFCGEGDFEQSSRAVHQQQGVSITHHIVEGLNEKDAHNSLWTAWREARGNHDLFVKVDADTVLRSDTTLLEIWDQFQKNSRVTGMQAPLHDYMTDDLLNGLNVCSSRVVFEETKDKLYCDRVTEVGQDIVLREVDLPLALVPVGFHCHHANERQAFHFGVHRALKNQHDVLNKVHHAWMNYDDRVRAFALIGARMASSFTTHRFNYCDDEFNAAFAATAANFDTLVAQLGSHR